MSVRQTAMASSLLCLCLLTSTLLGADTKPVKKTLRAGDSVNLVCEVRGHGDTTLVFLHGWCGDHEYWKHQVDVFAPNYQIVTLDQAGHGESGKDRKAWTASSLAEDVEVVVNDLGLKRVILVGHSMGGPIALLAAKRLPEAVVAVIGVDTLQNVDAKLPEEKSKSIVEAFEKDFKGTMRSGLGSLLNDKVDDDLKKWLITRAEAQDSKMAVSLMRDLTALDQKKALSEAKKPVRCINSAGGYQFYAPTDVEANKKYADYGAVTIKEVGHYPMLEKPDEFNEKLKDVLKEFAPKK
jgi:pimeloyl-ACP methyl ester carboxylesterase